MKTGGTSLADVIASNFAESESYPESSLPPSAQAAEKMEAYTHVPRVVAAVNGNAQQYRLVRAHVPYATRSLLDLPYTTITLLREPVERTLSYLKHCRKFHVEHRGKALEEIYDDEWFFRTFIENYQTKLFSMTAGECLAQTRLGDTTPPLPARDKFGENKPIPEDARQLHASGAARFALELFSPATAILKADSQRIATAKTNLEKIELVGVTEKFGNFLEALEARFGWVIPGMPQKNAGDEVRVSQAFRQRIADDNRADLELYEFAKGLGT